MRVPHFPACHLKGALNCYSYASIHFCRRNSNVAFSKLKLTIRRFAYNYLSALVGL